PPPSGGLLIWLQRGARAAARSAPKKINRVGKIASAPRLPARALLSTEEGMRKLIAAVAVPLTVLLPAIVPAWDQAAAATRAPAGPARAAPERATDIVKIIA